MIGEEAAQARAFLDLNLPVENGVVRDFEDMSLVWDYTWNKLGVRVHPVCFMNFMVLMRSHALRRRLTRSTARSC
jgi:actin-related protein